MTLYTRYLLPGTDLDITMQSAVFILQYIGMDHSIDSRHEADDEGDADENGDDICYG